MDVWRRPHDGVPGRRDRLRIRATPSPGTRRLAALDQRLFQQRALLCALAAHDGRRRLRGRRLDGLLRLADAFGGRHRGTGHRGGSRSGTGLGPFLSTAMSRRRCISFAAVLFAMAVVASAYEEVAPPAHVVLPPPKTPEASLASIIVPPEFEVELVAAEPLVMDPIDLAWGADGRLWMVEMADYPLGLDGKGQPGGRIRFL